MKNIPGFTNIGSVSMNHHHENVAKQNPLNKTQYGMPAKPDKNPDPTRFRPGVNEPEKADPTRISEPSPAEPARIDNPPPTNPEPDHGELPSIW